MGITAFSGAPILNAAVHCMCACRLRIPRQILFYIVRLDLVNVAVKLDIDDIAKCSSSFSGAESQQC